MADLRMKRAESNAQPPGWIERRMQLRMHDGKIWRRIAVEYSESAYKAVRLKALEDLKIDLLPKDELEEYLEWLSEEIDCDLSDSYSMYLGYPVGEAAAE